MIVAILRGRNVEKYSEKCIDSLYRQNFKDWRAVVCLDAPEDNSCQVCAKRIIYHEIEQDCVGKTVLLVNEKNLGLTANMIYAIKTARCEENDIILIIDLDDWIADKAFSKVIKTYEKHPECLLTYGSYIKCSLGRTTKRSREYKKGCDVRKAYWQSSHLKTFKYKLYRHIPENCFKDANGNFIPVASDVALTMPMLELAGLDRCRFIGKPLYYWRDVTPWRTNRKEQLKWEKYIRLMKPLDRLEIL